MLEHLHIKNLALIEDMELDFSSGINVLTGETGSGKSFILKSLGFLLGDKLPADIVRPGAERAQVEAIFQLNGEELILRRELLAGSGRSRFYINDSARTQESMRELRERLISHTSQHAQQQLLQPAFQAQLLEKDMQCPELLAERDTLLAKLRQTAAEISQLKEKQGRMAERRELLEMQKAEIDKVKPQPGEEERLEEQRSMARSNVAAKQDYNQAMALLHGDDGAGVLDIMADLQRVLQRMSAQEESLSGEAAKIGSMRQELQHMGNTLPKPRAQEKLDMNAIEERLFAFAQLKRKLKRSYAEILSLREEIAETLSFLDSSNLDLSRLRKEQEKLAADLKDVAERIKPLRRQAGDAVAKALVGELKELGFSEHVAVIPEYVPVELWPGVEDERGRILWAPNPGQNPQPLDRIASGGELSRFLLALQTVGKPDADVTCIFDEVDAGVGGLTLNKLADKLAQLAGEQQLILITHWPQLASRANRHFQISKVVRDGSTYTLCEPLDETSRRRELARMAGGGEKGEVLAQNLLPAH